MMAVRLRGRPSHSDARATLDAYCEEAWMSSRNCARNRRGRLSSSGTAWSDRWPAATRQFLDTDPESLGRPPYQCDGAESWFERVS
jgi:hypothetical protein